jgi:ankyrin repeat protein
MIDHVEMVEFLLRYGASPTLTVHGYSPLHAAASEGNLKIVQILLRYGARLDTRYDGETPLLIAAGRRESLGVISELVSAGANINDLNDLGGNAVSVAASQHNAGGVKLFASMGVDACAKDHGGETALDWADWGEEEDPDRRETLAFLKAKCSPYEDVSGIAAPKPNADSGYLNRNSPLRSKFWVAISEGDLRSVSDLITESMNLNFMVTVPSDMRDEKGRETTPLLEAVAGGHPEMVEFLIQHGSAVNFHPAETGSALHWAAWSGSSKVVMVLLRHGASVDERNYYGETPLILAATHSADISVVKELIAAGANVHAQSKVGDNAVMGAA